MKAAIYSRVSTEDQEREGTSLQSQLEACKKLAQERGYEVNEKYIIREVYSGLTLDRPDLTRLRCWLGTREVSAVIIYSSDRFSRDGYDFLTLIRDCERANVELLCVTEPIEHGQVGELLSYVRGWASKLEAQKIRERTMRGLISRAKGGRLPGGKSTKLYGYTYLPGKGIGEGVRYVNEEEARWAREVYRWLVEEGLAINAIVFRLRALDVPTPSGHGHWGKGTVHKMLTNPAYMGRTYVFTQTRVKAQKHYKDSRKYEATHIVTKPATEWVEIPNATPAIISEEMYEQAQAQLQRNRELAARNVRHKYLLRGYVFCKSCGRRYAGSTSSYKTKGGVRFNRRYICPKSFRIISPTPCQNSMWKADYLEEIVWREIDGLLSRPEEVLRGLEIRRNEIDKLSSYQKELEEAEARFQHLEKKKDRVWKAYEITGDEPKFRQEIKAINESFEQLEMRKSEIKRRIELSHQAEQNIGNTKMFCDMVKRNLAEFTFNDKRLALEALGIKVWVDDTNVSIEGAIPRVDTAIASTTLWHSR